MRLTFWGTRGSISTPGKDTVRYGGNTPCIEVRLSKKELIILDAGTGIRELGNPPSGLAVADTEPDPDGLAVLSEGLTEPPEQAASIEAATAIAPNAAIDFILVVRIHLLLMFPDVCRGLRMYILRTSYSDQTTHQQLTTMPRVRQL